MATREKGTWERRYEAFLRVLVKTAAALLGLYIMYQAISSHTDRPWLYLAAMGMMGLPAARGFEKAMTFLGDIAEAFKAAKAEVSRPAAPHKALEKEDET